MAAKKLTAADARWLTLQHLSDNYATENRMVQARGLAEIVLPSEKTSDEAVKLFADVLADLNEQELVERVSIGATLDADPACRLYRLTDAGLEAAQTA